MMSCQRPPGRCTLTAHRVARPGARCNREDGFGFVAILMALLIAAALYFGYFKLQDVSHERRGGIAAIDASRGVACLSNRQTIERALAMWAVSHDDEKPSFAALERDGIHVPSCPEGGVYTLSGNAVRCSKHP